MVGNITFLWFLKFWPVAVNTVDELQILTFIQDKKHLKNVGPIRHNEPPYAHSAYVATGTVTRRLRIDVHDANDNDNAWQRGRLWPHGMGPIISVFLSWPTTAAAAAAAVGSGHQLPTCPAYSYVLASRCVQSAEQCWTVNCFILHSVTNQHR